jgi:hypothetical protein
MGVCNPADLLATPGSFSATMTSGKKQTITVPFKEATGSLMYLVLSTKPDIAFVVIQILQFCENPQQAHWNAVRRIFAYLKGTRNRGLRYGPSITTPTGYSDSDYGGAQRFSFPFCQGATRS